MFRVSVCACSLSAASLGSTDAASRRSRPPKAYVEDESLPLVK